MRAPSSFHSTDAGPVAASADATSVDGLASIGNTGRLGSRSTASRAERPPVSASVAAVSRSPVIIDARRIDATGTSAAAATADVITPSSAP